MGQIITLGLLASGLPVLVGILMAYVVLGTIVGFSFWAMGAIKARTAAGFLLSVMFVIILLGIVATGLVGGPNIDLPRF